MRIERVDDKTVKCFLSNEELEEYEIDYKDFVLRSEKAKEIVKEIIEQASQEVGYKPPQFAFDLQIMMLPEQGLILTFSEKEPFESKEGDQIIQYLKEMKNAIQRARESVGLAQAASGRDMTNALGLPDKAAEDEQQPVRPAMAIFSFDSIRSLIEYADILPKALRVDSELYIMDDVYYLCITKGGASYERYSRTCIQALEYGILYSAEEDKVMLLREHGECIIAEKALRKLKLS